MLGLAPTPNQIAAFQRTRRIVTRTGVVITDDRRQRRIDGNAVGFSVVNWAQNPKAKTNITGWSPFAGASISGATNGYDPVGGKDGGGAGFLSGTGGATPSTSYAVFEHSNRGTLLALSQFAMPVVAGQVVRLRARVRIASLSAPVGSMTISLSANFFDNALGNPGIVSAQVVATPVVGQWYDLDGTVTVPATSTYAVLRAQFLQIPNGATFTVNCDRLMICDNTLDPGFFVDGDSYGSWLGTANASVTRRFTPDTSFFIGRAATNLFRRGQCDALGAGGAADSSWSTSGTGITRALDTAQPSPYNPAQSIKYVTDGTSSAQGLAAVTATGQAAPAGTLGVGSIFFKGVSGAAYNAQIQWQNTDGTSSAATQLSFTATGQWQIIAPASQAVAVGKTGDFLRIQVYTTTARAESFWAAHAMLESGQPIVAPYVATSGAATATRASGRAQAPSSLLASSQGWFAVRMRMGYSQAQSATGSFRGVFTWSDAGQTNVISLQTRTSTPWWKIQWTVAGAGVSPAVAGPAWNAGDLITVIGFWTGTTIGVSVNGSAFVTAAITGPPTGLPATFDIGSQLGTNPVDSEVLWAACGKGTLLDADAAAIAALPATRDPGFADFPSAAAVSAIIPLADDTIL